MILPRFFLLHLDRKSIQGLVWGKRTCVLKGNNVENQIQLYHEATSLLLDKELGFLKNIDRRLRDRYREGYDKGWQEAKDCYCVTYHCSVCGGTIEIVSENAKQAVKVYMKEQGWGHLSCFEK
jgi:hypothetical protein